MRQIHELTAAEIARQVRDRTITPVEVAQGFLARMDALEPRLEAWVRVDRETVLADAQQRQAELESGAETGPLHGVPIGIKDIYHIAGIPTTAGSKVYADYVPDETAVTIDLLHKAGAIMLGKTVTTEFACLDPSHTKNPWNPAHTPGGSSSGSAVSVAARMCPIAMGSQTMGSVLRPASYNGIVGLKPSYGRVSRYGLVAFASSLDQIGPMTGNVEDAALLLQVLAGHDSHDSTSADVTVDGYVENVTQPLSGLTLGVVDEHYGDGLEAEIKSSVDEAIRVYESLGATIKHIEMPHAS